MLFVYFTTENQFNIILFQKPEGKDTCSCFYFAGRDVRVNHADATTLCQIRGG